MNLLPTVNLKRELAHESQVSPAEMAAIERVITNSDAAYLDTLRAEAAQFGKLSMSAQYNSITQRIRAIETARQGLDTSRIYTVEAIRKVCIRYALRFLHISRYEGDVPEGLATILQTEMDKLAAGLGHPCDHRQMAIIAPVEHFKLDKAPLNDPMILVPLADGRWYLLHQWGNDFTVARRWKALGKARYLLPLAILLFSASLRFAMITDWSHGPAWNMLSVVGFIGTLIFCFQGCFDFSDRSDRWNSRRA